MRNPGKYSSTAAKSLENLFKMRPAEEIISIMANKSIIDSK